MFVFEGTTGLEGKAKAIRPTGSGAPRLRLHAPGRHACGGHAPSAGGRGSPLSLGRRPSKKTGRAKRSRGCGSRIGTQNGSLESRNMEKLCGPLVILC